jgi:hypothetical protein
MMHTSSVKAAEATQANAQSITNGRLDLDNLPGDIVTPYRNHNQWIATFDARQSQSTHPLRKSTLVNVLASAGYPKIPHMGTLVKLIR